MRVSLELLQAQVARLKTRENPDGDIALPSWVDALLLGLHALLQSTAKPAETPAPAADAAANGHADPTAGAAAGPSRAQANGAAARTASTPSELASGQPADGMSGGPPLSLATIQREVSAAAAEGTPAAAPLPENGGPQPAQPAGGAAANGAAAGAAENGQPGNLFEVIRGSLVQKLEEQHRPGGLLSPEQQEQAAMVSSLQNPVLCYPSDNSSPLSSSSYLGFILLNVFASLDGAHLQVFV